MRDIDDAAAALQEELSELLADRPRSLDQLLARIKPQHYRRLRGCLELGKWPDGRRLTAKELENTMQLLILFETHCLPEAERVLGNLPIGCGAKPGLSPVDRGES